MCCTALSVMKGVEGYPRIWEQKESQLCLRWAQITRVLVITDKELNRIHREFIAERQRADLLSDRTFHRTWEQANSEQRETDLKGWRDSILTGRTFPG